MEITENNQYTVRPSKLIAVTGVVCVILFLAFTVLMISLTKDFTEVIWVASVFLVFILLGLFLAIFALKWRIDVNDNTLTLYHPFKFPNERSINFDEISYAKNGMNGLYIYAGEKKVVTVDTFAVGRGKLVAQLLEQGKFKEGIWQAETAKVYCHDCGAKLSPINDHCWKCGVPNKYKSTTPLQESSGEQPDSDTQPSSYEQPEAQEFNALRNAISELDKPIKGATGVVLFLAALNVLLGVIMTFFSDAAFFSDGIFSEYEKGVYYIIPGLLFLGLSFGIVKRSRVCMLIAISYLSIDAILMIINGGFNNSIAFLAMRIIFIISLAAGVRACFRYHTAINEYTVKTESDKPGLKKSLKVKIHRWQIITCAIIGCVGIGTVVYGSAAGIYTERRNINNWVEYSSGAVTMSMPSSYIEEYSEAIPGIPEARYFSAMSESYDSFAFLIIHQNILDFFELTDETANEIELLVLEDTVYNFGTEIVNGGVGYFAEKVRYYEAQIEIGDEFGIFRCFSRGNDIYIVGIIITDDDSSFFTGFFERVVIE